MIREEHMDLFGNESSGTYTTEKAVTSSAVASKVITIPDGIALARMYVLIKQTFDGTSTNVKFKLEGANSLSSGALSSATTIFEDTYSTLSTLSAGKELYNYVIPNGYKYVQLTVTPETGSSHACTAGKVEGFITPEFN